MIRARGEHPVLVLTERALAVRSALEPTAWIVIEELAGRAVLVDGQIVAEQSARTVAESVGRSKDAVARALRQLTDAGLGWSSEASPATGSPAASQAANTSST